MRADERGKWLNWFTKENIPEWRCPSCGSGLLRLENKDSFSSWWSFESKKFYQEEWFDIEDHLSLCFRLRYKCMSCGEFSVAMGSGVVEPDYDTGERCEFYQIKSFYPSPPIVSISTYVDCSELVDVIKQSFALYWLDEASCANKIRVAIEMLLDAIKPPVPRRSADLKVRRLNLHERLELLEKTDEDLKKRLLAIKWLGNAGSHESDISRSDLLDAYIILEHVLYDQFEREHKEKEVNALANALDQKYNPSAMQ